jgi:PAS domain S-box-containing protein
LKSRGASFSFLAGGGQLGEVIAAFDWSTTPLGPIPGWTPTLKASVGLVLRSPVPMVMLWGEDGIMIYNDAYSVFAGGRHPQILGSKVREGWPEVADFNDHVMQVCLAGGTLAYRDQELTLFRNGAPEQVWMNLDYSPIPDETGKPAAVIAIVVETSAKVRAERWSADERDRLRRMFEQAPGFMAMLSGPTHVFDLANAAYLQLIGHRDVLGKPVREALPEVEGQGFFELLDTVFASGEAFVGRSLKVWLQRERGAPSEERFVDLIYQPVLSPDREVVGIFVEGADVTERVLSEQIVRESEAQFRSFAEAMPNHVWTAPPSGMLDWFNSRVYEYSGGKPGELDGIGWTSMVHLEDLPAAASKWTKALDAGEPYETEFRLRRYDGVYRWHLARAVPISDASGKLSRWIGTNTDIDEQKRTAEKLAGSEARLRLAIEAGGLAVWEVDIATGQIAPSLAMNRLHGFPDDAMPTTEEYQSRYAPGEMQRLRELGAEATAKGESELEAELRQLRPDGSERWLLIRAQAADSGKKAIGVLIDITERRRAQQELRDSERRLRLSQNAAGIASLELDVPTGAVIGSDRFWEIWGLSRQESVHISVLENIVIPQDSTVRSTTDTRAAGTANPNVEYRIRRPDTGELRWLSRHIEFTYDDAGRPQKMFGVMQDITEVKEAQARQQMLTHELEHRIKNILAMVSAIASQTLRNSDLETASAVFSERLRALANAHDILTKTRWTTASFSEVINSAIAVLPTERVSVSGPALLLNAKMALSLALAVNELGTNSLKYGALSNDRGRVEINWTLTPEPDDQVALRWTWAETGGPTVSAPTRRGFGRFLIERVLASDFGGTVSIDYHPTGVVCLLVASIPSSQRASEDATR